MMRTLALWVALIAFASAADNLDAPAIGKRDRPIAINHPADAKVQAIFPVVNADGVKWLYLAEEHFDRSPTRTILVAPPGEYILTLGDSKIIRIVEEGRPSPNPNPNGDEDKDDKPNPKQIDVRRAIWIEEQNDRSAYQAQTDTSRSMELATWLANRGITTTILEDDEAAAKAWLDKAAGYRPAWILVGESGKHFTFEAPKSVAVAKAIVEKYDR